MFDYLGILIDGSIELTASTDTPAISTVVNALTGAKVLDLGTGGTPLGGLAAVLILPTAAAGGTLTGFIEASDSEDMTAETNDVHELGKFDIAAEDKGVITAAEVVATTIPVIVVMRISTFKRYVRAYLTVTDNFYKVKCYLTPFPFKVL